MTESPTWAFAFSLCELLGVAHPDYLLQPAGPLSWDMFRDWAARYAVEPGGEIRRDARAQANTYMMLAPHMEGRSEGDYPSPWWPYFGGADDAGGWDERAALERVKRYNAEHGRDGETPKDGRQSSDYRQR